MEKILKKVTPQLENEVKNIIAQINPKWARVKIMVYLKQAYGLFGIVPIYVNGRKYVTLTLGYKDCVNIGHGVFTSVSVNVPFQQAMEDVCDNVISYRLEYQYAHRKHPQALELMEM